MCALSWRNIQRYNAQHDTSYVQMTAYPNGDYLAIDASGQTWAIDRKANDTTPGPPSTTASLLRAGLTGDDEWSIELRRRVNTLGDRA